MQFNNRENPCLDLKDGGKIWKSRNVAVSVMIIDDDYFDGEPRVLLVKRGKAMTHVGLWCFPCGYLDWDETVEEAAIREVYEETGYIMNKNTLVFEGIDSNPSKFGQNVSIMFRAPKPLNTDINWAVDPKEVEDLQWFSLYDDLPDMAFDHKDRCENYIDTLD